MTATPVTVCDVFVAGGGPAGSAAAIALARAGLVVSLAELSHYDTWRPGESLPARVLDILGELGASATLLRDGARAGQGLDSAWGAPGVVSKTGRDPASVFAWQVDRRRFDQSLAEHARRAGAEVRLGARVVGVERDGERWRVSLLESEGRAEVRAGFLIDATGRAAVVGRRAGARQVRWDRLVSLAAALAPRGAAPPGGPNLLVESAPGGWWYSLPVPDGSLFIAYQTDADLVAGGATQAAWSEALLEAPETARRAAGCHAPHQFRVTDAGTSVLVPAAGSGWLAVGDAAAAPDPLAGDGVWRALRSAVLGVAAVRRALDGDAEGIERYALRSGQEFQQYLRDRARFYGEERRFAESPFWRRRLPTPG